jgi:uncharacterized iron-regulated membrane protein
VAVNWRVFNRKCHRWGAFLIALPFLMIILSGLLLQLKKDWSWVQPPTMRGQGKIPVASWDTLLQVARSRPEMEVTSWADIERVDVQPSRGMAKIQAKNRWEVQVDLSNAEVLHLAYRRSDLIESLHDGSWFHERAKLWVFLPTAVVVLGLWVTGVYLFFLPYTVKWAKRRREQSDGAHPSG